MLKLFAADTNDENAVVTKSAKANGSTKGVVITPEPPKVGVRILEGKTVIGGEKKYECRGSNKNETETFMFKLTRSDELEYGVTYLGEDGQLAEFPADGLTVEVKAKLNGDAVKFEFPELHFSHTGKYEFDVKEIAGNNANITYDTAEYHVVADGTDVAAYSSEEGIKPAYTLDGAEADAAVFTNTKKAYGDLEVSKKVEAADKADKNTAFSFNIALKTIDGDPYKDEVSYVKGSESGKLTPQNGTVSISLKAGETAKFTGLPAGTTYTVTEAAVPDKWTMSGATGTTGKIGDGEVASAIVTNRYTEVKGKSEILISKVNEDGDEISGAVFEVYRLDGDSRIKLSHKNYTWLNSKDQFTVGKKPFSITDLKDGTYEIYEVKAPEGYRIDKKYPVIFTIKDGVLQPELSVLADNAEYELTEDGKYLFTITNSETSGVKTGDNNGLAGYIMLMLGAMFLMYITFRVYRRDNQ